jgi:hypothetical protein
MARTYGHTIHRYQGEKLYRAEYIARKSAFVDDNGTDLDDGPHPYRTLTSHKCPCSNCKDNR